MKEIIYEHAGGLFVILEGGTIAYKVQGINSSEVIEHLVSKLNKALEDKHNLILEIEEEKQQYEY